MLVGRGCCHGPGVVSLLVAFGPEGGGREKVDGVELWVGVRERPFG